MPARLSSMDISDDNVVSNHSDAPTPNDATNRRKSGRVVKKTQHFVPDAAALLNGKRKRAFGQDDGEDGDGDGGASEEDSDDVGSEGEADDEELAEKKRKYKAKSKAQRKPAAKKTKIVNGGAVRKSALKSLAHRPAQKPRKARARKSGDSDEDSGLFGEVFSGTHTMESAAAQWVSSYERHNSQGMRDMVNFVLKSAGCDLEVTEHDIEDQDNVTGKLGDLQDEYQAQNITHYPLISKGRFTPQGFRNTLVGFVDALVATTNASSILYDDLALIENLQIWVTTMSSSAIRPFRHTATVVSLALVTSLCAIAAKVEENTAKTLRQMDNEKRSKRVNKGRVSALQRTIDQGNKKRETLEGIIKDIFDTVFVHRYRDVDAKIRTDCVQALGGWILSLPSLFFEGTYLKYIGWLLSDANATTRAEVVRQLQKLFRNKDFIAGLRTFTERFRPRLVEMATRDVDSNVRALAVEVLDLIREAGLMEPDDVDTIGRLLFDSEPRVRKAVVGFFVENVKDIYTSKIEELGGEDFIEEGLARDGEEDFDNPRISWIMLKSLAEVLKSYDSEDGEDFPSQIERGPKGANDILIAAGVESRFSLATQALYEYFPEIKEWEILAGYVLFDHSGMNNSSRGKDDAETTLKRACKLDEKEEIILLEVLNVAVKLTLTLAEDSETGKKVKKSRTLKGESLEIQEATARHLAQLIPRLLRKFGALPEAASAVLRLEHVLNLDVFQELRQDSTTYSALLDDINKQFLTHGNQDVLAEASAALLHARGFEDLGEITEGKVQSLWDDTINTLQSLVADNDISTRGKMGGAMLTGLMNTTRRISSLAGISDCVEIMEQVPHATRRRSKGTKSSMTPLNILLAISSRGALNEDLELDESIEDLEEELVVAALKSLLIYFMWKFSSFQKMISEGKEIPDIEVDNVEDNRNAFARRLTSIIRTRVGLDNLRTAAAGTLLDLHVLFATLKQTTSSTSRTQAASDHVYSLVKHIEPEVQELLTSVFVSLEKSYAKKSHKQLEIADDDEPEEPEDSDEDDAEEEIEEKLNKTLLAEQKLCEVTGKLVLAILARVIDSEGPLKGKLKERMSREKARLGQNFKEVLAHLDPPKAKKSVAKTRVHAKEVKSLSEAMVVEDDEDEVEAESPANEAEVEDLRAKELETEELYEDGADRGREASVEDEDDVMGD